MNRRVTRRDFLKAASAGTATLALLGYGASLLHDQPGAPLTANPSLTAGELVLPTACGGCQMGCGLLAHFDQGRLDHLEGNPAHPLSWDQACARAEAPLQAQVHPRRVKAPLQQVSRGSGVLRRLDWAAAMSCVSKVLNEYAPGEVAFLLGLFPDHLFDFVSRLNSRLGGMEIIRYGLPAEFAGWVTLMDAAQKLFGVGRIPYFDVGGAELVFSFEAQVFQPWLSPAAASDMGWGSPRATSGRRGYWVQFESYRSPMAEIADEWHLVAPGSLGLLARALAHLAAHMPGVDPAYLAGDVDVSLAAQVVGVPPQELERLAQLFARSRRSLALPGGMALSHADGLSAAEAILGLNLQHGYLGGHTGMYLLPDFGLYPQLAWRPNTVAELGALVERMRSGQIKALFIHGVNPALDLPAAYGFEDALQRVERVISFSPILDETAALADFIFPDHTPLESWGYQRISAGCDRLAFSAIQPAIQPLYDTRATVDVLISAMQMSGHELGFSDEQDFIRQSLGKLIDQGGFYSAHDGQEFWALWRRHGGWWRRTPDLMPVVPLESNSEPGSISVPPLQAPEERHAYQLTVLPWSAGRPDASGAGRLPFVELHPDAASKAGVSSGDVLKVIGPAGEMEAVARESPLLHPAVLVLSLQDSTRALDLLGKQQNASGNLATLVRGVHIQALHRRR